MINTDPLLRERYKILTYVMQARRFLFDIYLLDGRLKGENYKVFTGFDTEGVSGMA